ncbi:hypothetical protein Tco_0569401 [Tanacetum coccineum]
MLEDFSSNSKGKRTETYTILFLELKTLNLSCLLKEQLLEPALNLTVHYCGLEFRVLNGYETEGPLMKNEARTALFKRQYVAAFDHWKDVPALKPRDQKYHMRISYKQGLSDLSSLEYLSSLDRSIKGRVLPQAQSVWSEVQSENHPDF